jgi:hypothetical protein
MAGPVRPPRAATAPVADNRVNFGDDSFYTGGGGIPEGDYILFFDVVIHQYEKQDGSKAGPQFLAVRVAAYSFENPEAEPTLGYYSMGSKALQSFMPNVDDEGKSLLAIPGGPASSQNEATNWNLFRRSMIDCGLPQGVLTNDFRAIDGIWVHITHIPEPESRKNMGPLTGEAGPEERRNRNIAVVSEILDGGKPWEGTGGIPETPTPPAVPGPAKVTRMPAKPGPKAPAAAAAPPAVAPKAPPARRAPARAPAAAPPPPAETESVSTDADVEQAAQSGAASVIEETPNGLPKLVLRTGVFKAVSKSHSAEMATAVLDTYFQDDRSMNALLGTLGYVVNGPRVEPAP